MSGPFHGEIGVGIRDLAGACHYCGRYRPAVRRRVEPGAYPEGGFA